MTITPPLWQEILTQPDAVTCWQQIMTFALQSACNASSPENLHHELQPIDRILTDAAWPLWEDFPSAANHTSTTLRTWWQDRATAPNGRAILILDALSLRELPYLLKSFELYGVTPLEIKATGAEIPTDTVTFARALGLRTRADLGNDTAPASFILASDNRYTDVFTEPFADCVGSIPARRDIVIWHSWPDDLLTTYPRDTRNLTNAIHSGLADEGLWALIQRLRQGRQLVITSDHGYAVAELFHTKEQGAVKEDLARVFKAQRCAETKITLNGTYLAPLALIVGDSQVVIGQRWWDIQGGYPHALHGGLSLLEAVTPFIILPEA
jgi:hypothetical protein